MLEGICAKIVSYGFDYTRFDFCYGKLDQMMNTSKIISDKLKSLNPGFVIESHGSINSAFFDTVRTQDSVGFPTDSYNGNDWKQFIARRYRMIAMTSPNRVVDTDGFGGTGTVNLPLGTQVQYEQEIGLMLGYGRPIIYWFPATWPMYVGDGASPAYAAAEPTLLAALRVYATFPREVPERSMTDSWTTQLLYSNGAKVVGTLVGYTYTTTQPHGKPLSRSGKPLSHSGKALR